MFIPSFVRDRLPFFGAQNASYRRQDGHVVLIGQELVHEAERRRIDPKRLYSVGCLACDASALWPCHPWFAHYDSCPHPESPVYLQFAFVDRKNVLRLSNPPAKIRDQLFEEKLGT